MLGGWDRETLRWFSMGGRKCRGRKEREDQQEQEEEEEEGEERGATACSHCDDPDCGVRSKLLSSMHTVTLAADADYVNRDPAVLVRLLQETCELQRLSLLSDMFVGAGRRALPRAGHRGGAGGRAAAVPGGAEDGRASAG